MDKKKLKAQQRANGALLNLKHGMYKTRTHNIWCGMRQRCNNPKASGYRYYGGRGIAVCKRWESFIVFLADMGEAPVGLTLDRINGNKNYSPKNCRWVSMADNLRNRKNVRKFTIGNETKTIRQWTQSIGVVNRGTVKYRLDVRGWDIEKALLTPSAWS